MILSKDCCKEFTGTLDLTAAVGCLSGLCDMDMAATALVLILRLGG